MLWFGYFIAMNYSARIQASQPHFAILLIPLDNLFSDFFPRPKISLKLKFPLLQDS